MKRLLEICVDDVAGIEAAVAGGADRLELCSALSVGGLTPTPALVARAVATALPVHAMVRPRVGDFTYTVAELAMMADEIGHLAAMGVAGVVTGASRADGSIDRAALATLRAVAPSLRAVLHRAIDLAPDPLAAIDDAVAAGFDFVLSSGGAATALAGAATLRRMVAHAGNRLTIIGGSGVDDGNVVPLLTATRLTQIHASASEAAEWPDPNVDALGFAAGPKRSTSAVKVAAIKMAMSGVDRPAPGRLDDQYATYGRPIAEPKRRAYR